MVFEWLFGQDRHHITDEPFPEDWIEILDRNMPIYASLSDEEQSRLRNDLRVLIAEKSWEGCGGLELTDEIKVTIAAQASLLTMNRRHDYYADTASILVYPTDYRAKQQQRDAAGVVNVSTSHRLGEAWSNGPIALSWFDVQRGGMNAEDGRNVVYHEFAHKLDMTDGEMNGVPLLDDEAQVESWAEVMHTEFERLTEQVEKDHHKTLIDPYGATNPAEFFAVLTECFFEKPVQLLHQHPDLYHVLQGYYHQDPAARVDSPHEPTHRTDTAGN